MSHVLLHPTELRDQGFKALVASLGWVNAVRFVQEISQSTFDYTAERQNMLPDWSPDELVARSKKLQQ